MENSDMLAAARKGVVKLLADEGPQPGARLKQRLQRLLQDESRVVFDERRLGFEKFAAFLRAQADLVEVRPAAGPGDMVVSLREEVALQSDDPRSPVRSLRKVVWRSFTNPDPHRKRFLNKTSGRILHWSVQAPQARDRELERDVSNRPDEFVQIVPLDAATQHDWMLEFLEGVSLEPGEREALKRLLDAPYSSKLNGLFMDALGRSSRSYQSFRASRVYAYVQEWADSCGCDMAILVEGGRAQLAEGGERIATTSVVDPESQGRGPRPEGSVARESEGPLRRNRRALLLEVLDELDDDDIRALLTPAALLLATRRR